jgi:hypothetical protein
MAIPYTAWPFEDGRSASAPPHPAGLDAAVDSQHLAFPPEPHQVQREPHPERVHARAARDQQPVSGRQIVQECQPDQPRAEAAGLKQDEPAADVVGRKTPESAGQHIPLRQRAGNLAPAV